MNDLIDDVIATGRCEFNADVAVPLPCTVFLRLMGLPLADLDLFLRFKDGIIRPQATSSEQRRRWRGPPVPRSTSTSNAWSPSGGPIRRTTC